MIEKTKGKTFKTIKELREKVVDKANEKFGGKCFGVLDSDKAKYINVQDVIQGSNAQAWYEKTKDGMTLSKIVNRNHNMKAHKEGILKSKFKDYISDEGE